MRDLIAGPPWLKALHRHDCRLYDVYNMDSNQYYFLTATPPKGPLNAIEVFSAVAAEYFDEISDEALIVAMVETEYMSREQQGESVLDVPYEYLASFYWSSDDLDIPSPWRNWEVIVQQCGWTTPEFHLDIDLFDLIKEFQNDRSTHYLVEQYVAPHLLHSPEIDVVVRERCREAVALAKEQLRSVHSKTFSYTWHPPIPPLATLPTEKTHFEYRPSKKAWAPGGSIG